jgi:hypothetical protein
MRGAEFTAFLMTLRRKNLAPHGPLVTTYGAMLTAGFAVSTIDHAMHGRWACGARGVQRKRAARGVARREAQRALPATCGSCVVPSLCALCPRRRDVRRVCPWRSWLLANTLATLAAVLRLGLGVNKYVLWCGLALGLHFSRPYLVLAEGDGKSVSLRVGALLSLTAILVGIGAKKIAKYAKVGRPGAGMEEAKDAVKTE